MTPSQNCSQASVFPCSALSGKGPECPWEGSLSQLSPLVMLTCLNVDTKNGSGNVVLPSWRGGFTATQGCSSSRPLQQPELRCHTESCCKLEGILALRDEGACQSELLRGASRDQGLLTHIFVEKHLAHSARVMIIVGSDKFEIHRAGGQAENYR